MPEVTEKTEAQLGQEIGALIQEIGTRTYTRFLVDRELAALQARLYDANVELHNRRKVRQEIEAEAAEVARQEAERQAAADATPVETVEARHE